MSKKAIQLFLLLFISNISFSQDSTKTWFSGKSSHKLHYFGFYINPEIAYSGFAGGYTPTGGMAISLVLNKKWAIGMGGYANKRDYTPNSLSANKTINYNTFVRGIMFEYTPKPDAVVHMSFPLLLGSAMARIDSVSNNNTVFDHYNGGRGNKNYRGHSNGQNRYNEHDNFFVVQPGIKLETNVLRIAKIYVGANYRLATGKSSITSTNAVFIPTSKQLSGLSINFGTKIGFFDINTQKKRHLPHLGLNKRRHNGTNRKD